jgi:large conductance mechanosensitive channel
MSIIKEFKDFAMRGNVVDLAVGIVIGSAFGKIVSSLVDNVIMPPLGLIIGGVDFKDLKLGLATGADGKMVTLDYGMFVQTVFDFTIVAFAIFLLVKAMNKMQAKAEVAAAPAEPAKPAEDILLLTEIRDLLKK